MEIFNYHIYDVYYLTVKNMVWPDIDVAELLNMSVKQYHNLLIQYGATINYREGRAYDGYFTSLSDIQKLIDYLNEKYGVALKLIGG